MMRMTAMAILAAGALAWGNDDEPKLSGSALIDHWVGTKWKDLDLKPAKRADDAEFVRRVYLDVVGVIPSREEAVKFLEDRSRDKREKLVERLVEDKRYGVHWADVWSGILVGFDTNRRYQGLRNQGADEIQVMLEENLPYDEFARRMITAEGTIPQNTGMMMRAGDKEKKDYSMLAGYVVRDFRQAGRDLPKALAGRLTRVFMGVQIQCAQCHDHPFDRWTQEEFYGMASFFTDTRVRRERDGDGKQYSYVVEDQGSGRPPREVSDEQLDRMIAQRMKQMPEQRRKFMERMTPERRRAMARNAMKRMGANRRKQNRDLKIEGSESGPIKPSFISLDKGATEGKSRRVQFAEIMTSMENGQFAKMAVNRYWAHFFGRGIVDPVDDFNGKNKPTHPELLDALSKDFVEHRYDVRWLIRAIAGSEAYQLTSKAKGKNRDGVAEKFLALGKVRSLSPEQILRSALEAVGFGKGMAAPAGRFGGKRAAEFRERMLAGLTAQFRFAFGDDEGGEVVEFAGSIPSALLMMNGQAIGNGTSASRMNPLWRQLERERSAAERVKAVFLSALSRPPTRSELTRWTAYAGRGRGMDGYEDLLWTLINTSEFLFNH